ncbi:MAG: sulfatase [Verrucomicrobiae bacterium]|nr:sulfatase [Verrucomicrobiae bacterium]
MKPNRVVCSVLAVLWTASVFCTAHVEAARPPNLVFILADDLGWTDLGCQGSRYYETPAIDALAAEGMRFTAYYNCQNCAPTRAALMSGQYAPRTGIYTVASGARGKEADRRMIPVDNVQKLPLDKVTVAEALRRAGYRTGMFGKWHLGTDDRHHPSQRGFDEAIVANGRHFDFKPVPPEPVAANAYLADWLTDHAVDFIRRHREEPFFLYLPHFAVHSPLQAKADLIERFRNRPAAEGHNHAVYAAMIASVDESVGRVMACLESLGLADDTVLIFSSDNGGVGGYASPAFEGRKGTTDNWPLREGKGSLHEGGVRVPLLVRWPGHVKPGSRCDAPLIHVDLYPTLLALAGAEAPTGQPLDGASFAGLLTANEHEMAKRPPIFWHFPGYLESYIRENTWRTTPVSVIRDGDFKLMEFLEDGHLELYNLDEDLSETTNLAATLPDKRDELLGRLREWRVRLDAPMPQPIRR